MPACPRSLGGPSTANPIIGFLMPLLLAILISLSHRISEMEEKAHFTDENTLGEIKECIQGHTEK